MIDLNKLTKTGNKQIDDEHIQFLTNINNLYAIIKKESDKESISAKLSEMILYAREHFLHEEDIINSIDYPNAKQHKREHEKVLNNMQLAIMQCREKNNTDFLNIL